MRHMTTFYTVDRRGFLEPGKLVQLTKHDDISPPELMAHANQLFPNGVSAHGNQYFLGAPPDKQHDFNARIEAYVEAVRAAFFPARLSRFVCMFATDSLEAARRFRERWNGGNGPIFAVESERFFRADMSLLRPGPSILVQSFFAHRYWRGEPHPVEGMQEWEWLLELPVNVGSRVDDDPAPICTPVVAS